MFELISTEEMGEVWKDIPGYEGYYQVSDLGRVRSLDRVVTRSDGACLKVDGIILKNKLNNTGYYCVNLSKTGLKVNKCTVHSLVAMCFLNHKPCGYKVVIDHINNNKLDNRLINIQLTTQRNNASKDRRGYSSKYIGVSWSKLRKKWSANIIINKRMKNLGFFIYETDAAEAYQKALKTHLESSES